MKKQTVSRKRRHVEAKVFRKDRISKSGHEPLPTGRPTDCQSCRDWFRKPVCFM